MIQPVILLAASLALAVQAASSRLEEGLAALRDGRYADADRLLSEALAQGASYDGLVAMGIARGRLGDLTGAGEAFDRAIALDPARPEAWVERGGLHFLQKRYESAVFALKQALERKEDAYARDLLASSLHLAGRSEEALEQWNLMGQPVLRQLEILGLVHTRDRVARREITLSEGALLDVERLRETRLRLSELGIFDRITLRPLPQGNGAADLQIALTERHGFYRSLADLAISTGVNALYERVGLRYSNLLGAGVNLGGEYRWERNRPQILVSFDWPRPLGLGANLRLVAFRGRQEYDFGHERIGRRSRGLDLGLRRVLDGRIVGQIGLRTRDRSFSRFRPDAPPGDVNAIEAVLERRFVETHRHRLEGSVRVFQATGLLGSAVAFPGGLLRLRYRAFLAPPEGSALEPGVLAVQVQWGRGGARMPLDEMFAPGASPEMEFPLRAHPQTRDGALGQAPIGRSLTLANLEVRRRFLRSGAVQFGAVFFYDGARIANTASGPVRTLHDVGFGLRLGFPGSTVVRVDYGHGLTDGRDAVFAGLNQVF